MFWIPQKWPNIWATFEREFVTKNFQKSPNLITLDQEQKVLMVTHNQIKLTK